MSLQTSISFCRKEITDDTAATIRIQSGEQLRHSSRAVLSTKEQLVHLADVGDFDLPPTLQRSQDGSGREQLEAVPVFQISACGQSHNCVTFATVNQERKQGKRTSNSSSRLPRSNDPTHQVQV